MKAILHERYGPADLLRFAEVETPRPAKGEVRVEVRAAALNAADWRIMRAAPFLARFDAGLLRPKHPVLGADVAGVVDDVGSGVTELAPGDLVFGDLSHAGRGTFAEYVCSGGNAELVRSIGAAHVVDYTQVDFSETGHRYDVIIDAVGNRTVAQHQAALAPDGSCIVVGFTTLARLVGVAVGGSLPGRRRPRVRLLASVHASRDDLRSLGDLVAAGRLAPVIDRRYPLAEAAEAIRYMEQGHAHGKVVLQA